MSISRLSSCGSLIETGLDAWRYLTMHGRRVLQFSCSLADAELEGINHMVLEQKSRCKWDRSLRGFSFLSFCHSYSLSLPPSASLYFSPYCSTLLRKVNKLLFKRLHFVELHLPGYRQCTFGACYCFGGLSQSIQAYHLKFITSKKHNNLKEQLAGVKYLTAFSLTQRS